MNEEDNNALPKKRTRGRPRGPTTGKVLEMTTFWLEADKKETLRVGFKLLHPEARTFSDALRIICKNAANEIERRARLQRVKTEEQ